MIQKSAVLAVVLNYRGAELTVRCVEHLEKQRGFSPDVLVVDNGSADGSVERLRAMSSPCQIIALESNLGFAGGMNVGIKEALAAGYQYVWLVNNDAFPHPDCLKILVEGMESTARLGMVTPRIVGADGVEQLAGGLVNWRTGEHTLFLSADLLIDPSRQFRDGTWLSGAAPLIRTSVLEKTGLFEPAFFAYWEDVDLSVRMTRMGHAIAAVPEAEVLHLGSATSGLHSPLVQFLQTRNTWLFLERNARSGSRPARWLRFAARFVERAARYRLLHQNGAVAEAIVGGISAARQRRFFAPGESMQPQGLERLYLVAPWRLSAALMGAATWLEPTSDSDSK